MAASDGFAVTVEVVEELGSDAFVYGQPADSSIAFAQDSEDAEDRGQIIVRWDPKNPPKPGDTITVSAESLSVHLFNAQSGERLN
jgi:multiple sugar transport system ATP-binding protein